MPNVTTTTTTSTSPFGCTGITRSSHQSVAAIMTARSSNEKKLVILVLCALLFNANLVESFHHCNLRRSTLFTSCRRRLVGNVDDPPEPEQSSMEAGADMASSHANTVASSPIHAPGGTPHDDDTPQQSEEVDSLWKFSRDVKHVLHDLRGMEYDPCIPKHLMGRPSSLSYSKTWTLDDWEYHNSRKRYFRYLWKLPHSRLLRRIIPQQAALLSWTFLSLWIDNHYFFKRPQIPLSALGPISTFLAFLLTLRSNQGLSRLDEGRRLWSKVILNTREMSQLISAFIYPVDKQLALMLGRHVAVFGWLLKSQLRFTEKDEVVDIVRTMLPNKKDADYVLSQRQKTAAVITRIRQVISHLGKQHRLTTAEEIALDHTAHALSEVITSTGRIRASPIPTLYTSHTSRLLVFYLFCLPPALHMSGLDGIMTTLLTMMVGFAMLGLDEISHLFEQPFRVIPMYQMSKRSMLAVADSLTCRPPALVGELRDDEEENLAQKELTTYWSKRDISSVSDNLME
jgi:predicted membrane chloride channel (bestrophin family)